MQQHLRELSLLSLILLTSVGMVGVAHSQLQVPFDGLKLVYFSETTQTMEERTGIYASWWTTLQFRNVTATSSVMDISVNGTVKQSGQEQPQKFNDTITFPTDRDTLIFLRNGGQENLTIFAGSSSVAIPVLPGLTIDLTRSWNLHDKPLTRTPLGAFSSYRYHTALEPIALPIGGTLDLNFYAAYEMTTQVLIAWEAWATISGASAMVAHTEIREANIFNVKGPSQCLIATATYGSDLAPEVKLLREFRDQAIGKTFAGENFLLAFNTWYYSFSPSVANQIRVDSPLQTGMQALLVPLLLSLKAGAVVFSTLAAAQPELAAILSGLLASGLIGIAYLSAPILVLKTRYPRMKRATGPLLMAFTVGLSGLAVAEVAANGHLAAFTSTTLILANMLLFAFLPSTIFDRARRLL